MVLYTYRIVNNNYIILTVQLHAITPIHKCWTYFGNWCLTLPTCRKHGLKLQNSPKESILKCNSLKNIMKHGIFHETFHSEKK